ncbi:MAG: efflux RND transporter periplasmic adaptor subunit [Lentisphaerae bacterium]|nr:efflux RND transporter periplasmic adaptor subunit [Lentisphaerota bacterium]
MKLTGICLCAGALLLFCGCAKEVKKSRERSTRVETAKLQKRLFRQAIPVQGTVTPLEYATISAKTSGTLEVLKVDEGDYRKAGETLFCIDSQVLKNQVIVKKDEIKVKEAALRSSRSRLQAAEISLKQALADFKRASQLYGSKAISQANFESAETVYKKAETEVQSAHAEVANAVSQLKQAQSNLAIAEKNLADSEIKAPFDCVITDKFMEENEFVSVGTKILKLENHARLEVVCHISAVYYDLVNPGKTEAEFLDAYGKSAGKAVITYKSPAIDPGSRTFKLKILVPTEIPLHSGMLCEMKIILLEKTAYGLPADAVLLRAAGRRLAYTVGANNRAESVDLQIGITADGYTEILNADKITGRDFIVSGQTFINNGALLEVVKHGETK